MTNQSSPIMDDTIFLGRIEEQDRFREVLRSIRRESNAVERVKNWVTEKDPAVLPFILLLYGEGGMGKTRLAKRLSQIAVEDAEFRGHFRTIFLDWEKRKELDPLHLVARDAITPEIVFDHIYSIFRDEGFGHEFDPYEKARKLRTEAESKVVESLNQNVEGGDRYTSLRAGGGKFVAWLLRTGMPGGAALPEEPTARVFESIIGNGAEALVRARETATMLVRSTLIDPDEFNLFILPNETLARHLADSIRASASRKPIVFILDTYEIADRADVWLRVVMKRTGSRVAWIIAGRDNLADSRKFGQSYFTGYRADFTSERLRVFPLGEFSVGDVTSYFAERAPGRHLDAHSAEAIHRATLGIPLAVREAAAIWRAGASLDDIVSEVPPRAPREHIVRVMTERFLLHCFDDSAHVNDRTQLYGLALAYRPDPELLEAMLQSENLEDDLSDLERRHSFVFVSEMKLHDAVSEFLREYLLQEVRRKSRDIHNLHARAVAHLQAKRDVRESTKSTLEVLVSDERWTHATLGLIHHSFWLDEDVGWASFMPALVCGLGYDRGFTRALVETVEPFTATLTRIGQRRFKIMQAGAGNRMFGRPEYDRIFSDPELPMSSAQIEQEADLLAELEASTPAWSKDSRADERQAILDLQRGKLFYSREKYSQALMQYEKAMQGLPDPDGGNVLRKKLSASLEALGWRLGFRRSPSGAYYARPIEEAERAYGQAVALGRDTADCYRRLGKIRLELGRNKAALDCHLRAIELDPKDAQNHNALGDAHHALGRHDESIADYQRALELDPKAAYAHDGLGKVYLTLGRLDESIAAYQRALELNPENSYAHISLGRVYDALGRVDDSMTAYERALEIDPNNAYAYDGLGQVYGALGRLDESVTAYKRALELDPNNAYVHNNLSGIYAKQRKFDDARHELNERIRLKPANTFAPLISLGILARHQGLPESEDYFRRALGQWETAWLEKLQWPAKLLENKAIALLCLARKDEATQVLAEAIIKMWPGNTIDFEEYRLLESAPVPPDGVEQMIEMLKEEQARRQKK